jgi:hypothetical protein
MRRRRIFHEGASPLAEHAALTLSFAQQGALELRALHRELRNAANAAITESMRCAIGAQADPAIRRNKTPRIIAESVLFSVILVPSGLRF